MPKWEDINPKKSHGEWVDLDDTTFMARFSHRDDISIKKSKYHKDIVNAYVDAPDIELTGNPIKTMKQVHQVAAYRCMWVNFEGTSEGKKLAAKVCNCIVCEEIKNG